MTLPLRCLFFAGLAVATLALPAPLRAQELREQPTPFTVWLDFEALSRPQPPRVGLPIWLESFVSEHFPARPDAPEHTVFRLRLRRMGHLNSELQLRVFFDDQAGASPVVSGWTETGTLRFQSEPLGTGVGLLASAAVAVPVEGTDYVEISVPGNGSSVRGAFAATLKKAETRVALDFAPPAAVLDPFQNAPPAAPPEHDAYLFGRVQATLEPGTIKLAPGADATARFEVQLDRQPLVAVVTFEVLSADVSLPPELTVNDRPLGPAALQLPDLADPAYLGEVRPLERDMRFRYTGWLRCQKLIPGSALVAGLNRLDLVLNRASGPLAVRAVEIQLKHNWQSLDYTLLP